MFDHRAGHGRSLFALLAACVVLAGSGVAAAQESYVVKLKDGSIYQGDLVEYVPEDHVTIHLATGETRRFAWSEIANAKQAPGSASTTDVLTSAALPQIAARPPAAEDDIGPRAGAMSVDLRIPISFAVNSPDLSMKVTGIELGLGARVSERWYAGGVVGWEMGIDSGSAGMFQMLREGVETKYGRDHTVPGRNGKQALPFPGSDMRYSRPRRSSYAARTGRPTCSRHSQARSWHRAAPIAPRSATRAAPRR